jgi:SAM-dependent methyltransferase
MVREHYGQVARTDGGCGCGIDAFLAAKQVGTSGRVIVINLSPDKTAVFREAFRVLRPGGRLAISDIVASAALPKHITEDPAALAGCIAGAPAMDDLRTHLEAAGFAGIHIEINEASRSHFVAAATIRAMRSGAQADAAKVAGVSLSGMKSRVQRGRRLIRDMFEECCSLKVDARGRVVEAEQHEQGECAGGSATCSRSC